MNRIAERIGKTEADLEREVDLRELMLNRMIEKKFYTYRDVTRMINRFYKDRDSLLKELGINEDDIF